MSRDTLPCGVCLGFTVIFTALLSAAFLFTVVSNQVQFILYIIAIFGNI